MRSRGLMILVVLGLTAAIASVLGAQSTTPGAGVPKYNAATESDVMSHEENACTKAALGDFRSAPDEIHDLVPRVRPGWENAGQLTLAEFSNHDQTSLR